MTLVPNETEQALNRQHDAYAAAREEYRKKIAEQAVEIERLRAALEPLACTCDRANGAACSRAEVNCAFWNARAALMKDPT